MNDAYEKRVQNQFGGFCIKVLKNEARHIQREYARQREREMSIDDLTSQELEQTSHEDHYFNGEHSFEVDGFPVVVVGDTLAKAISQLPPINQEVILKSYFLGMTDREISEQIGVCRQSITKRRNGALKLLRRLLMEEWYECTG